jgi:hypothetical protein
LTRIICIPSFILCLAFTPLQAQDVAIEVSAAQITAAIDRCFLWQDCETSVADLVASLTSSNPGTRLEVVIGSVAVGVAQRSNAAIASDTGFNAATHAAALRALAGLARRNASAALARTVTALALNVTNRLRIDLDAIANGQDLRLLDAEASPA